ncbi:hypothetical protein [Pengzhenrongella sp.]|uniref:hypothetical protein n=1 Tax=Pengzhenrongella sp. TaxID=2888820 RepID=UPI002F92712F
MGEALADRYCVATRQAWQIYGDLGGTRHGDQWCPFDEVVDLDREPADPKTEVEVAPITTAVIDALIGVGWERALATDIVESLVDRGASGRWRRGDLSGARRLGVKFGIPQWQAHRVMTVMLGTLSWPGLVERLATGGDAALQDPAMLAALRATVRPWSKGPAYEARVAARQTTLSTHRRAS